ncbi:Rv0361 family membrane protein [Gordonia insulae]|uniref:DUF4878 domain-containing protein n=1 Tax=Gordonia insulae TaxID=2420509 RepID=A0A3G8JUN4_9ACTN|nr:hypothetical protein [Gordonia insulae]AZG48445.1 hypothetical protein D7316_05062 [Gordonia insulae]
MAPPPYQPFGPMPGGYPPPFPPPPPPRRNGGVIAAIVAGVLAVVAVSALVVTVAVRSSGSDDGDVAVTTSSTASSTTSSPDGESAASQAEVSAIRSAMQNFVDAVNSRSVARIQASVCTPVRSQVTKPLDITGNVVLEELSEVTVTGDSAESTVSTHLEVGNQRSTTKQNPESFARENGTWFVCPGAEPDIGT